MASRLFLNGKYLQFLVAFVLAFGSIFPTGMVVLAEDTVPPTTQEEIAPVDPAVQGEPVVETSAESPAGEVPANPPSEVSAVEATVDSLLPVVTAEAAAPITEVISETTTTTEAIIQAAEENGVTLADANGDPITMATEESADLLENGDPFFWNGSKWVGYTLTGTGCPNNVDCYKADGTGGTKLPFQAAIDNAPANTKIYVAANSDASNPTVYAEDLIINKADLSFVGVTSVKINNQNNSSIADIVNGYASVNKITLSVNFGTTTGVFADNIFISTGANLVDALALVSNRGVIELGEGIFVGTAQDINKDIHINKSVEIKGQGSSKTTILAATDNCGSNHNNCPDLLIINPKNVVDVIIHDLTLDGKNTTSGADIDSDIAINVTGNKTDLEVYNTVIQNFYSSAIAINGNNIFNIHDNTIQNILPGNGYSEAISVDNDVVTGNHIISNNTITKTDFGINFNNSLLDISGNSFSESQAGIYGKDSSANISNNNFFTNDYGICIEDLDNNGSDPDDAINVNFNRFYGNTVKGLRYEYDSSSYDPIINAANNWWGCNYGANGTDCDKSSTVKVTLTPFLKLGLRATPNSIFTGETSTLTPVMYSSTDGSMNAITGLTWFTNLPTVSKTGTSFGNLAGTTFTAGTIAGIQNFITSLFDKATATASVQIKAQISCDDGDPNTIDSGPVNGECTHTAIVCNDGNLNTTDSGPVNGQCTFTPIVCNDGDLNTTDNGPVNGQCTYTPIVCNDGNLNTTDSGPVNGQCTFTPIVCNDGDPNTTDSGPVNGQCTYALVVCSDGDPNTIDSGPVNGQCTYTPIVCNDGDINTVDVPVNGVCTFTPIVCDDENPNTIDASVDGVCTHTPIICDDGNLNTTDNGPVDGECKYSPIICDDQDSTTVDSGPVNGVCIFTPVQNPPGKFIPALIDDPFTNVGGLIPITGGLNDLSCTVANTLSLPNGDKVVFSDILCEFQAALTRQASETLLSPLPTGLNFVDGFNLEVQKAATLFNVLPQPVVNTLSFVVPAAYKGKSLKIFFWDTTFNKGLGGWIELPVKLMANGEVVTAPLSLGDERVVVSGVEMTTLPTSETTLNFTGLFILAAE